MKKSKKQIDFPSQERIQKRSLLAGHFSENPLIAKGRIKPMEEVDKELAKVVKKNSKAGKGMDPF